MTGEPPSAVQSKDTTLQLHGCYIHGVAHMAAVTMEGGKLRMEGRSLSSGA